MVKLTKDQIISSVMGFVGLHGGAYSSWYVGIASDPCTALQGHNVCMECAHDEFIALNSHEAYNALESLLKSGFDGELEKDSEANFVYVYKKSENTKP